MTADFDNFVPKEQPSPPDIIYLQWWDEAGLAEEEVTWCKDNITGQGVKYVHYQKIKELQHKLTDKKRKNKMTQLPKTRTPSQMLDDFRSVNFNLRFKLAESQKINEQLRAENEKLKNILHTTKNSLQFAYNRLIRKYETLQSNKDLLRSIKQAEQFLS